MTQLFKCQSSLESVSVSFRGVHLFAVGHRGVSKHNAVQPSEETGLSWFNSDIA